MNLKNPSLSALFLGASLSAHAEFVLPPNGNFETAGGASWTAGESETNDPAGAGSVFSFPDSEGNPGGFARMNLAGGSFAVIFSEVTLDSLNLTPGEAYDFKMDMKNLDGPGSVGKLKIEFPRDGEPGNISEVIKEAELIDGGTSWQTYTFTDVPVPPGATTIRFVPLLENVFANVGFDNVGVDNTPVVVDPPPMGDFLVSNGDFETGGAFWSEATDGPTGFSYPADGGNPDGFAAINFTDGNFAVIFTEPVLLSTLGLTAGETYVFRADMINLNGAGNVGRLKIEFPGASPDNFGDMPVDALKGDGSTWETYEWTIEIPADATTIKFTPVLIAADGPLNIGYDNIGGTNTPVEPPPFVPAQIPNGGFEADPLGANWNSLGQTTPSYIDNNTGNPGRFVQLSDGVGAFSVLYAFDGAEVTYASLGLAPGDSYSVQMDMKIVTASSDPTSPIGGLRLQGPEAFVEEIFPPLIGDGSTWETYTIELTVPDRSQVSFGLRPGKQLSGATVAFDNVSVIVPSKVPFAAEIERGTVVSWEPTGVEFVYQPQKSADGVTYTDFGPPIMGDEVTSSFDAEGAAFYQVVESSLEPLELITDPGFEDMSDSWNLIGSTPPQFVVDSELAFEGSSFMRMAVATGASETPETSTLQQFGIGILATDVLEFSFWANVESRDETLSMGYSIKWRAEAGNVISEVGGSMNSLPVGEWTQVSLSGLVPPEGTTTALIQFDAATGAVMDQTGAVRIDNVSLVVLESGSSEILPATQALGVQVSWPTRSGSSYQPRFSTSLSGFTDLGPVIMGDGGIKTISDVLTPPAKFYDVVETP